MNRYILWALGIVIIVVVGFYLLTADTTSTVINCAKASVGERDSCCANQPRDIVVITCQGNWKFNESLNQCNYVCSTSDTKTSGVFCTSDVKACPDGSFVGRDRGKNCEFKACP